MRGFIPIKAKAMKINSVNNVNYKGHIGIIKNIKRAAGDKFAQIDQIGEGTNIALDFAGKAVLVPATIMLVSKEDKEKKEYSALKNPIAATIQLLMEVPILMLGSKLIEKLANSDKLYKPKSGISYNEKSAKDLFLRTIDNASQNNESLKNACSEVLKKLEKKGFGKSIKEDFEQIIENYGAQYKEELKKALLNLDKTHKNLYHLQNRLCFLAAIILTPILCKAEDYLFPKIMNLIIKNPEKKQNTQRFLSLHHFKNQLKKGGIK